MAFERVRRHALINILIRHLDFARKLNVVVRELADFDVVDAGGFFFFGGAETQRGEESTEEIERAEDEARAEEGVGAAGEGVGELVAELDPVAV
jgi:hypothetical protein